MPGRTGNVRTLIIGGFLGGLAAAHEMTSIGADVALYERSTDRTQPRGAGIVMQPEVAALLAKLGRSVPSVSVALAERQQLHRHGAPSRYPAPQWMTSWDTLHDALRSRLAPECVRLNSTLEDFRYESDTVTAVFEDGSSSAGDLLIGADGIGSAARRQLTGSDELRYAGYVAFRGLEPEASLPSELHDLLAERFTLFAVPGLQLLCYLVPGAAGETAPGQRRANWVWYVNIPETSLAPLLSGISGRRYDQFLPPGELAPESGTALLDLAERELPEPFHQLVRLSRVFMQPVYDLPPTRMAAGHVALIGDAAGTVRPHTASGTSKAFGDAAGLARAVAGWHPPQALPAHTLQRWQDDRSTHLRLVADTGVRLAAQSALGPHGPQFLQR